MYCYHCNATLDLSKQVCNKCGADIRTYKRIVYASNRYYNEGLTKARARDLSGAVDSLRQSLALYKKNIDARNLLGLVYYAMGEAAEGLKQWIISENMTEERNIAHRYITLMCRNLQDLDSEGNGIRKFNQALTYASSDAKDMAVIQLKKVISVHRNMTKAYNLLALLYIDSDRPGPARKVLNRCLSVDRGNVTALAYLKELDDREADSEGGRSLGTVGENDREQLIIPVRFRDFGSYLSNSVYVLLGVALGILISWFVIVPGRVQQKEEEIRAEYQRGSEWQEAAETKESGSGQDGPREEGSSKENPAEPTETEHVPDETLFVTEESVTWNVNQDRIRKMVDGWNSNWTEEDAFDDIGRLFRLVDPTQLTAANESHYRNLISLLLDDSTRERILHAIDDREYMMDYEKAAKLCDTLIYLHPEEEGVRLRAGKNYQSAGDTAKAANRYWQEAAVFGDRESGIEAEGMYFSLTGKTELPDVPDARTLENERKALSKEELLAEIAEIER